VKFASPMLTAGPTGTLATMGMEYLCNVLSAIVFGTNDVGVMDLVVDGVVEGGSTRGQSLFWNDSGFSVKVVGVDGS